MAGGSSGTETATQTSEPWSQAQPYLRDIFSNAQSLYRQGAEYYPGSTVVPYHGDTVAGMQGLRDQFQGDPIGLNEASGTLTNIAGGQGGANPFMSQIQVAGNRANDAGSGALNDFLNTNQSNPYLDQRFDQAAGKTRDNINAIFSKSGRYGSVAHQGQMGESIGDLAANMYGNAYETDANRRFGAAEALGARQAGDINRQLGAATTGASLAQSGDAQAMQAAGMLPGLNDYAGANNRGLMGVGNMYEQMAGRELQDSMDRWNFGQSAGWDLLNRYNATVQPMAALGGTSTSSQPRQNNTMQNIFGAGLGIAGLFSDRRLKADVKKIGTRKGLDWYSYRYIWDEPGTRHEGVMAQDVERIHPNAVSTHESGFKIVDYGALGVRPVLNGRAL